MYRYILFGDADIRHTRTLGWGRGALQRKNNTWAWLNFPWPFFLKGQLHEILLINFFNNYLGLLIQHFNFPWLFFFKGTASWDSLKSGGGEAENKITLGLNSTFLGRSSLKGQHHKILWNNFFNNFWAVLAGGGVGGGYLGWVFSSCPVSVSVGCGACAVWKLLLSCLDRRHLGVPRGVRWMHRETTTAHVLVSSEKQSSLYYITLISIKGSKANGKRIRI